MLTYIGGLIRPYRFRVVLIFQQPLSMEASPLPFVIPSSLLACGKLREE
jgi:hypothetical protein